MRLYFVVVLSVIIFFSGCSKKQEPEFTPIIEVEIPIDITDIFIPNGGSVYAELQKLGYSAWQITELTEAYGYLVGWGTVHPNDHFQISVDPFAKLVMEFSYLPDIVNTHRIFRNLETNEFEYEHIQKPTDKIIRIVEGVVYTTLNQALIDNKVDPSVRNIVTNALSSRINFASYTRKGDTFKIMYEETIFEGNRIPGSKLFYMFYTGTGTGSAEGFRYDEPDERSAFNGYYTTDGTAMATSQFRWPLDRVHVTSRFGNRIHPITRRWTMHSGTDYRASTGTPVYAVANGRVIKAGFDGGWGNVVEIQHENNYVTQYAHLHRINTRLGSHVTRGTRIGSVGSTGFSTGPHLHFGLRVSGRWRNPADLRMVAAIKLEGARLEDHQNQIQVIRERLSHLENRAISPFELSPIEKFRRVNARSV